MPFVPHTESDIQSMLKAIGVKRIDDLFDEIPETLRIGELAGVPPGLNEMEVGRLMRERAAQDGVPLCFAGAGAYDHHIPAAVWAIVTRGEFYSAYTPYQAEASQGTLQLIYEYQSMLAGLTGLDVSNASLYDGATAFAEACLMAVRSARQARSRRVLVPRYLNPVWRKVALSLVAGQNIELVELAASAGRTDVAALAALDGEEFAALCIPSPNFLGAFEPVDELTDWAHARGMLVIAACNPTSLALLITTSLNELPEGVTECRCQRLHMQNDVEVLGGTECQAGLFHGQARGRAADQDVLVGVCRKPFLKNVQPSHHGSCPFSSSSAVYRCAKQHSEPGSDKRGAKVDELHLTPLDLIDRIAALVPPPRTHRHRYFGVLAPNSPLRAAVTALAQAVPTQPATTQAKPATTGEGETGLAPLGSAVQAQPEPALPKRSPAHYLWAVLIARIYEVFPLLCPKCGGQMRLIAFVTEGTQIRKILDHIGVDSQPPHLSPARGPPLWEDCGDAQIGDGAQIEPDWDLAAQPAPDYEVDQRISW